MTTQLLKSLVPPFVLELYRTRSSRHLRFTDKPSSWREALSMSSGYSIDEIRERAIDAARAVVNGRARYERDTVLFDDLDLPLEVLSALLRAALLDEGRLQVLDFGGALGSTYMQCRRLLDGVTKIDWRVVEQPAFAEVGATHFSTTELSFFPSLRDACPISDRAIFLLCSVLQYIEGPDSLLRDVAQTRARHLVIDRTPMHELDGPHRLCIQRVPTLIYAASYPCWILSRNSLLHTLAKDWSVVTEYTCREGASKTADGLHFSFKGLILERKS
jgi:putative methyltransferase (TIGR04325 family)